MDKKSLLYFLEQIDAPLLKNSGGLVYLLDPEKYENNVCLQHAKKYCLQYAKKISHFIFVNDDKYCVYQFDSYYWLFAINHMLSTIKNPILNHNEI